MTQGHQFGWDLADRFSTESKVSKLSEVQQFRALIRSFGGLKKSFHVEEYHGSKHQVFFNGQGAWKRSPARCELCDVVILVYSLRGGFRCRVTFLQAKYSKEKHPGLCAGYPHRVNGVTFKANLEQWDLLSRRPEVLPVPPFKVHPTILSQSILASVGSFGVFHRLDKGVGFFYASADILSVVGTPSSKHGRLATGANLCPRRTVSGLLERTYCCCLPVFGEALYNLEIGTPIEVSVGFPSSERDSSAIQSWVRNILSFYIEVGNGDATIATQLRDILGRNEKDDEFPESIPSLVLIHSESEPPKPVDSELHEI